MPFLDDLMGQTDLGDVRGDFYNSRSNADLQSLRDIAERFGSSSTQFMSAMRDMLRQGQQAYGDISGMATDMFDQGQGFFDMDSQQNTMLRGAISGQSQDSLATQTMLAQRNAAAQGGSLGNAAIAGMGRQSRNDAAGAFNQGYLANLGIGAGMKQAGLQGQIGASNAQLGFMNAANQAGSNSNQALGGASNSYGKITDYHANAGSTIANARMQNQQNKGQFWQGLAGNVAGMAMGGLGGLMGTGPMNEALGLVGDDAISGFQGFMGGMTGQSPFQGAMLSQLFGGGFGGNSGGGQDNGFWQHTMPWQGGGGNTWYNPNP